MANAAISKKLKEARKRMGLSQQEVYTRFGIGQSAFSAWENGVSEPDIQRFLKLCELYQITDIYAYFTGKGGAASGIAPQEADFLDKLRTLPPHGAAAVHNCLEFEYNSAVQARQAQAKQRLRRLPVFLQPAAAGLGNYLDSVDAEELLLAAPEEADIGLRISGDSMEPVIQDGEIVFVKYQPAVEAGEIGVFCLNGEAYCKKLLFEDGQPCLVSVNPAYQPIVIRQSDTLVTYGKVLL